MADWLEQRGAGDRQVAELCLRCNAFGYEAGVGSDRVPDISFRFDHDAGAARRARRALRPLLEPDDPLAQPVALSASELISNVVTHTESGGEMRVWDPKPDVPLRLEVEDSNNDPPVQQSPNGWDVTGRGLRIVQRLSDAWGTFRTAAGKVVWAEFNRKKR